jgi:hypothetical protein
MAFANGDLGLPANAGLVGWFGTIRTGNVWRRAHPVSVITGRSSLAETR